VDHGFHDSRFWRSRRGGPVMLRRRSNRPETWQQSHVNRLRKPAVRSAPARWHGIPGDGRRSVSAPPTQIQNVAFPHVRLCYG
jgi:hypothetical protein